MFLKFLASIDVFNTDEGPKHHQRFGINFISVNSFINHFSIPEELGLSPFSSNSSGSSSDISSPGYDSHADSKLIQVSALFSNDFDSILSISSLSSSDGNEFRFCL